MSDSRTNEQIAADAITAYWRDDDRSGPNRGPLGHDMECGKEAVAALEAAGRLAGEPTEAQVEAAAKAMWDLRKLSGDPEWDVLEYGVKNEYRKDARAALVAAQGAAPQAAKDIHEPDHDRVYCVRCGGNWPCQPPTVLPSSGVDEDKLAEVIEQARDRSRKDRDITEESLGQYIARTVNERRAEWLK